MQPLISVIMPVYDVEAYLPQAISSVLAQRMADFELILVDDGSPDRCGALCDEAAAQDKRIRVLHQRNRGLSAARNAGIDLARGQWLFFVDSDDFLHPDCLQALYVSAQDAQADIALCGVCKTDATGVPLERQWPRLASQTLSQQDALRAVSNPHFLVAWNKLYRREIFATLRYPEGHLNEDDFLAVSLYATATRVVTVSDCYYYYRQTPGSIMKCRKTLRHLDEAAAFAHCIEQLCALHVPDAIAQLESYQYYAIQNVWQALSAAERKSPDMRQALQQHAHSLRLLLRHEQLRPRAALRSLALHTRCTVARLI